MKRILYCAVALIVVLTGCSKPTAEESLKKAKAAYEHARIKADSLGGKADNARVYEESVELYSSVADSYPDAPEGGEALFMLATIRNNHTKEYAKAIESYRLYAQRFPQGERAPISLFLMGYLYNNELRQFDSAGAVYRRFLAQFPNHELALSAQFELQTLGKAPEDLLPPDPVVAAVPAKEPAPAPKKRPAR
jgi:outer membrane protein assembly factor BamD (BamD/ComL family)